MCIRDSLIYDVAKCFDEVWPEDTINVLYDLGVRNQNLCLLYEGMKKSYIMIKTPSGETERFEVEKIVAQGSTWGPLAPSASIDSIGKDAQETGKNCYTYKDTVKIPPLSFVDDVAAITKCGVDSIVANSTINTKILSKKLRLGAGKCHQMHIGESRICCPEINVHENKMEKVKKEKYLGDVITAVSYTHLTLPTTPYV